LTGLRAGHTLPSRRDVDLQAGYTLNDELLLRNLPSDCDCVADVAIVADRAATSAAKISR
jgi:hypothetical protein